ncbi:MAG: hypothetical protein U0235_19015 [Polyangiaceae bacterium]
MLGAKVGERVGDVVMELDAARHHVTGHDGEVGGLAVGRGDPPIRPGLGRERADVQVRELDDAEAVEPRIEIAHGHVEAFDDEGASAKERAVSGEPEADKVDAEHESAREGDLGSGREREERPHDGGDERRNQREEGRAEVHVKRDVDETHDEVRTPAIGHHLPCAIEEERDAQHGGGDAPRARMRDAESREELGGRDREECMHRTRQSDEHDEEAARASSRAGGDA